MGLPFLVLGTFSQAISRMPRSGRWMEIVKSVFGLLMIGAGLYYLQIGIPAVAAAFAPLAEKGAVLGPVMLAVGLLLGALHLSFKEGTTSQILRKSLGVGAATLGLVAFLGWLQTDAPPEVHEGGQPIAWHVVKEPKGALQLFEAKIAEAKAQCRPVMIDFFADWCIACKELDKYTYSDADVRTEATRYATIKIDATTTNDELEAIQARYGVKGLPTVVFISRTGEVLEDPRVTGFLPAPEYLTTMKRVQSSGS
jgi:thiol:disulfide interchange protein DsbD